jgi:D-amino-acid oxidase
VVDALVIGAGVCGLTTAVVLAERKLDVVVHAREELNGTTSWAAGAVWGPVDVRDEDIVQWGESTRQTLMELVGPETGISLRYGVEASRDHVELPFFLKEVDAHYVEPGRLLSNLRLDDFRVAWRYATPVINMPFYLRYLKSRFLAAGGRLVIGDVATLADAPPSRVVINCSGAGARGLVPDATVEPVRGQLVVVKNPGVGEFFAEYGGDHTNLTYIFPMNAEQVVLGSTFERDNPLVDACPKISQAILDRCAAIDERLVGMPVLAERVGFRCVREGGVRLEHERVGDRDVIHNYGHGSGGVSLSWGCAVDVASRVQTMFA